MLTAASGCVSWILASQHKPCSSRMVLHTVCPTIGQQKLVMSREEEEKEEKKVEVSEGVLMGEEITPESAHSSEQTHTHLPFTGFSLLF